VGGCVEANTKPELASGETTKVEKGYFEKRNNDNVGFGRSSQKQRIRPDAQIRWESILSSKLGEKGKNLALQREERLEKRRM